MKDEIYKPIEGIPNYLISNFGHVKNIKTRRILKSSKNSTGYNIISIRPEKNKIVNTTVNKLLKNTHKIEISNLKKIKNNHPIKISDGGLIVEI